MCLSLCLESLKAMRAERSRDYREAVRSRLRKCGNLRLIVLGRGSQSAEGELRGIVNAVPSNSIAGAFIGRACGANSLRSDVLLFVRGHISSGRGSAIAGIACGLPVVAFEGAETSPPITEQTGAVFTAEKGRSG